MVQLATPLEIQSREGSIAFEEFVESTIVRIRAPPQEPLMERLRTTTLGIPIQTYSSETLGGASTTQAPLAGTSLEVT